MEVREGVSHWASEDAGMMVDQQLYLQPHEDMNVYYFLLLLRGRSPDSPDVPGDFMREDPDVIGMHSHPTGVFLLSQHSLKSSQRT